MQVSESAAIIQFNGGGHQNGGFVEKNDLRETETEERVEGERGREGLV